MSDVAADFAAKAPSSGGASVWIASLVPRQGVQGVFSSSDQLRRPHDVAWMRLMLLAIFLGLFCVAVNGIGSRSAFSVGLLLSAACLAVGGLAGFLFGVPRSLQTPFPPTASTGDDQAKSRKQADESAARYSTNTNLEQISDWLTKIMVGVGLTQVGPITQGLNTAATYFGAALGEHGSAMALCVMLYFWIAGFFYTYLWTRLILVGVMSRADQDACEKLRRIEEQDAIDLRALTVVDRFLSGKVSTEDAAAIDDAIDAASARAKKLIFYEAEEARTRAWRQNKTVVERTIPIFRALLETDRDGVFYKTKAKLAYALKDQRQPTPGDLEEAILLLDEAIDKRDLRCGTAPLYEFNRAVCRMMLDEDFKQGRPSSPERRRPIAADLDVARPALRHKFGEDPIARWVALNSDSVAAEVTSIRAGG